MTIPTKEAIYKVLCNRHTKENQDKLMQAKVAIAGLGGLGSNVAVALARVGIGQLHLIDFDKVDHVIEQEFMKGCTTAGVFFS